MPVFVEDGPQRIRQLRALMNEPLTSPEHYRLRLLFRRLGNHKPHLGLARRDHDRLSVSRIVFLALHEGAYILRRDQPDVVTKRFHLLCPIACAPAGLKHNQSGRLRGHEGPELVP